MIDWHFCLVAVLLFPLAFLFRFVGCTAVLGDFDVAYPTPSLLKLNFDPDLQKPTPADNAEVKKVKVFWSLWSVGSVWKTVPAPPDVIVPTDALDDFLDPTRDPGAQYSVSVADLAVSDEVSCTCEVTQGVAGGVLDEVASVSSNKVALQASTTYVFTLEQKPPVSAASKRVLVVGEYIPS
jgi:hypothetical protein